MEPEIDYKAMTHQLQDELEQARLQLLAYRYARRQRYILDLDRVRGWLEQNYLMIAAAGILLGIVFQVTDFIYSKLGETTNA